MHRSFTSFEFIGMYSTKSVRSVITGKETGKYEFLTITAKLNFLLF